MANYKVYWKQLIILMSLLLMLQHTVHSQIITVEVNDFFYYDQKSDTFTFYIVEELSYLQSKRMDEETRNTEFNKRVEELHDFLDEKKIAYELKPLKATIKENYLKKKLVLKRHDLIVFNDSNTREVIKEFVQEQKGILFQHHPLEKSLDLEFMKSCMRTLEEQARLKAQPYAQTQNKTCGEIHEINVVQQITNTKRENSKSISEVSETATHIAHFTLEISFKTVNNK